MNLILILFTMKNLIKYFNKDLFVQTYNQVGVQADSVTIFNTESLVDIPESGNIGTVIQSNVLPDSLHAEVHTNFLWKLIKKSLKKIICMNSSDRTPQDVIGGNTMNNLDPSQNIPANTEISESSVSNAQELALKVYDIMDEFNFGIAFSQPNAIFDHKIIEGIHQYFICYSDTLLSVSPDLINFFF